MALNMGEMLFDTVAEYDEEIATVRAAITRQMAIGSGHMNNSGGSSRSTTEVDISQAREYLKQLRKERSMFISSSCDSANFLIVEPGW